MKVAIQGIRGAFHEVAAKKHFGKAIDIVECETFKNLCDSLQQGKAEYALMAIENTIAGSILGNYALIREYGFYVMGEVYLNIKMNLLTLPGVPLSDIEVVESHPIALQQCHEFLHQNMKVRLRESNDTAESARDLYLSQDRTRAVVASARCAELYGLEIVESGIETHHQNFTRFLVLGTAEIKSPENNKASLSLELGNEIGCLADVLVLFRDNGVNLTKIQSTPVIGMPYQYHFHIDVEWDAYKHYEKAVSDVTERVSAFQLLGEYRKSSYGLNQ